MCRCRGTLDPLCNVIELIPDGKPGPWRSTSPIANFHLYCPPSFSLYRLLVLLCLPQGVGSFVPCRYRLFIEKLIANAAMKAAPASTLQAQVADLQQRFALGQLDAAGQLDLCRQLFVLAAQNRQVHHQAQQYVARQLKQHPRHPVYAMYAAALLGMGAQYAVWPLEKFKLANDALRQMDHLLHRNPEHPELRFIRGAFGYKLPGVMGRKRHAWADLRWLLDRLPQLQASLSPQLFGALTGFFLTEVTDLPAADRNRLTAILASAEAKQVG